MAQSASVAPNQYNQDGYINCRGESDNPVAASASQGNVFCKPCKTVGDEAETKRN